MRLGLIRRVEASDDIYKAICAYDGFEMLCQLLQKKYKIGEITALLQQDFLRTEFPANMSLQDRQMMAIRIAGNIENMSKGTVVRKTVDPYNAVTEQELAKVIAVHPTDEYGNKQVEFIGLTGMWAGLRLHTGGKGTTGRRLFNLVNKGREDGILKSYSELHGHVFELTLRVMEGKAKVMKAALPSKVSEYNRLLRAARLKRGDRCKSTCLRCTMKAVADADDNGDMYLVCCPLTGRRQE